MASPSETLSGRQAAAVAALLSEPTVAKAAARARVGERTLLRWLKEPRFAAEYRAARRAVVERAVAGLQLLTSKAVEALGRSLDCGKPPVEIRAALGVLDRALAGVELFDLASLADRLEEQLDADRRERVAAEARRHFQPPPPLWNGQAGGPSGGPGGVG
jgi:hypothetical protein